MNRNDNRITMLQIPLIEEKYGLAAMISFIFHGAVLLFLIFGAWLFPQTTIRLGSGEGGGIGGGDIATVGLVEQFSGGAGMVKPGMVPQPPALVPTPQETAPPKVPEVNESAIPIPEKVDAPKAKPSAPKTEPKPKTEAKTEPTPATKTAAKTAAKPKEPAQSTGNAIPVEARPGSGGVAGTGAGSGGGTGSGLGISIGPGSGGIGDSWYAQVVEKRISDNWSRPPEGINIDMTYSFYINANGGIYDVKQEKSSGNRLIDLTASRAINAASPLSRPPREFQGRKIQFVARFVHPPGWTED